MWHDGAVTFVGTYTAQPDGHPDTLLDHLNPLLGHGLQRGRVEQVGRVGRLDRAPPGLLSGGLSGVEVAGIPGDHGADDHLAGGRRTVAGRHALDDLLGPGTSPAMSKAHAGFARSPSRWWAGAAVTART
jgi:hypothetical protein